jgi:hypothetical protein
MGFIIVSTMHSCQNAVKLSYVYTCTDILQGNEYLVQWKGNFQPTWEPETFLNPSALASYKEQPIPRDLCIAAGSTVQYHVQKKLKQSSLKLVHFPPRHGIVEQVC